MAAHKTMRLAVRGRNNVWAELKPAPQSLAQLFTPRGETCPNAPFKLRFEERTYIGTGEHASRLIGDSDPLQKKTREYPQFRTMRPPPGHEGELGEYLIKDLTLERFREEVFDKEVPQTACWITDLEFDTETSLSLMLHYCSLSTPHYYEEGGARVPEDARLSVRMFFLALL
jgi:hypothetical protein